MVINTVPFPTAPFSCPGPLVWFNVAPYGRFQAGAVLECNTCRAILTSGNFMDSRHVRTPIITSPR